MEKINLNEAIESLLLGEIIILPTETVYGIFTLKKYLNQNINKIYDLKERKDYSNHFLCDYILDNLDEFGRFKDLLPGPVTLILNKQGYRYSSNKYLQYIINKIGILSGTSANLTNEKPITNANQNQLNCKIFDGGKCEYSIESTIISIDEQKVLRIGAVDFKF